MIVLLSAGGFGWQITLFVGGEGYRHHFFCGHTAYQ